MSEPETETIVPTVAKRRQTWPEFIGLEKYAYQIYRLQEEAGLSFKEARAVLTPTQLTRSLAEEWECSYENVCNMSRRGIGKVRQVTSGDPDKMEELMPTYMSFAD